MKMEVSGQYERLHRLHVTLLGGSSVHEAHARLYRAFPSSLGFASKQTDGVLFQAVLILALSQAGKAGGEKDLHKVYFLTPQNLADGWVLEEFKSSAKRIFDRLKTGRSVEAVKHVGQLFHQVMVGSQIFSLPKEPERWVAFGFSRADPIPDWMREKLLDLSQVERDLQPGV
jgi:hypothetical protein